MARFHGEIGFLTTKELDPDNRPGIYDEVLETRNYYGDVYSSSRRWDQNGSSINDNLVITNRISVVADSFIKQNIGAMKYVTWQGIKWKITNAEVQYPRIILTIGGEYHAPEQKDYFAAQVGGGYWQ